MLTPNKKGISVAQQNPFSAFIELIELDQTLRSIHAQIKTAQNELEQELAKKTELVTRFDTFKTQVKDLRKAVDAHELEIKELDEREQQKKSHMDSLKNPHEYQPLKREIDHLKIAQNDAEVVLMSAWNKLETAQKELQIQQKAFDARLEEIHTDIATKHDAIEVLKSNLETTSKDRPLKMAIVPQEWMSKYNHISMQVSDPVVAVINGGCDACFYTISHQDMLRLQRSALLQCKNCFRLIYIQDSMKQDEPIVSHE